MVTDGSEKQEIQTKYMTNRGYGKSTDIKISFWQTDIKHIYCHPVDVSVKWKRSCPASVTFRRSVLWVWINVYSCINQAFKINSKKLLQINLFFFSLTSTGVIKLTSELAENKPKTSFNQNTKTAGNVWFSCIGNNYSELSLCQPEST
jgi:hypothetical protein